MDRAEAITMLKRGLGYRVTQDESIIAALQSAQRTLEHGKTLPIWLLADFTVTVTSGTTAMNFGARFLRWHEDYAPYYVNADGAKVFLRKLTNADAYPTFIASGEESGELIDYSGTVYPKAYAQALYGGTLYPIPTTDVTLLVTAYKSDDLLDTNIENLWLLHAPDYIIGEAGMMVAGNLRDKDALVGFKMMRDRGAQAYLAEIIETETSLYPLIMGRNN